VDDRVARAEHGVEAGGEHARQALPGALLDRHVDARVGEPTPSLCDHALARVAGGDTKTSPDERHRLEAGSAGTVEDFGPRWEFREQLMVPIAKGLSRDVLVGEDPFVVSGEIVIGAARHDFKYANAHPPSAQQAPVASGNFLVVSTMEVWVKITAVDASTFRSLDGDRPPSWLANGVIANPMSIYPRYQAELSSWSHDFAGVLVEIRTDEGVVGIGTAAGGDASVALVNEHLARLIVGEDPVDIERLWDQMFRSSLPYGRKGLPIMAISGVDNALWDLLGKAAGVPVYRLLGGACREDLPIYQTTNDRQDWREADGLGVKLSLPYGLADGKEGLALNLAFVRECRETLGSGSEIMLDGYMGLDVEYTRRLIDLVEPLGIRWIEEPLAPDDYHGYEALGKIDSPVSIATGEHEFTRWGFVTLIETGGVTILQPDVAWVGGISEARRICTLASSYHLSVIPHLGALQAGALHLMKSQVNTPIAEWLRTWDRSDGRPRPAIEGVPDPVGGTIRPSEEPGLGIRAGSAFEAV